MELMSSVKAEILWSPLHEDKFIVWGPDITLYEVIKLKDIEKKTSFTQISSCSGAVVVASQSANGVRSVDISAIPDQQDPLLALGYSSGKVSLTSLKQTYDALGLVGKEFVPRYPRLCNTVSWNPVESNILAAGLEKHRSDHCIMLWDVTRGIAASEDSADASKPIAEMGLSETAHSVTWARSSNRTLLASMNLKYIKVFDLRDLSSKAVSVTTSRACYGVTADPFSEWRFASRGDCSVCVWDTRALAQPLLTLTHARPVLAAHWSPTRRNLLVTLQRDSNTVRLHDIQQAETEADVNVDVSAASEASAAPSVEGDSAACGVSGSGGAVLQREVGGRGGGLLAAAPHPARAGSLLCLTAAGGITEYTVSERVTVGWGARGGLVWGGEGGTLRMLKEDVAAELKDVSHIMKKRAQTDYGLKQDLWQNADLAEDEALSNMWHFLALSKSLVDDGCIRNSGSKHPGVWCVVRGAEAYRSEAATLLVPEAPARRVTVHRSQARVNALQLCSWGWGWESAGAGVERAEAAGAPCRAAALAAFHLRVRSALDVLSRAHEPLLRVVAAACAGASDERGWRDAAAAAAAALPDPYLRALLRFLAAAAPRADYSEVLNETEMRLSDRVAFACIYLPDAQLQEFVQHEAQKMIHAGDLAGLLLTGASAEGARLLQRWVEVTGDVQSAALVAARCFPPDLLKEPAVDLWLDSYRSLLESWGLWWARCALGTWRGGGGEEGGTVAVACTYCGKSVAAWGGRRPPRLPPPAATKQLSCCPHCRKPLPRCALCHLHVGGGGGGAGGAPFHKWFSWCVACRHGGHAHHLLEWFQEHSECPVSSCNCRCSSLDPRPSLCPAIQTSNNT